MEYTWCGRNQMIEEMRHGLELAVGAIQLFAAAVIVLGFTWAIARYFRTWGSTTREEGFHTLRIEMGRPLLLGLELLVVSDVIETITTEATFQSLGVLALLVVVRTLLSWSLALQVEGKWPWQPETKAEASDG